MKNISMCAIILAILAGCSTRPRDAEEAGDAGAVRKVDTGGLPSKASSEVAAKIPRVVPIANWIQPQVPLIEPPQVISIWFYPQKSRDGMSYREGFWCHRVVRAFTWGKERAMVEQAVSMDARQEMDAQGIKITTGEQQGTLEPQPWFIQAFTQSAPATWTVDQGRQAGVAPLVPPADAKIMTNPVDHSTKEGSQ